jgi:hypothetical protein
LVFGASAFVVFALAFGNASADTLRISDLTDGTPTVHAFDSLGNPNDGNITMLADSGPEFLHFTYQSTDVFGTSGGVTASRDLNEAVDGSFSDRLFANGSFGTTTTGLNISEFKFASDPATAPTGSRTFGSIVEDGTSQFLFNFAGVDNYFVQSDVSEPSDAVPEIDTGLMASALTVLSGGVLMLRGRRRRV